MISGISKGRVPIPARVERRLNGTFRRKTCVVRGTPLTNHWHHLDEDNTNSTFHNLIPLSAGLNSNIESHRKQWDELEPDLGEESLWKAAKVHYRSGFFGLAYGCARLASFLQAKHLKNWDSTIRFASYALLSIRPLWELDLASDTLRRSVINIFTTDDRRREIEPSTRAELALEIGSYFRDAVRPSVASKWDDLADRWNQKSKHRKDSDFLFRLALHGGVTLIGHQELQRGIEQIERTIANIPAGSFRFVHTNGALWLAKAQLARKDLKAVDKLLQEARSKEHRLEPDGFPPIGQSLLHFNWRSVPELLVVKADWLLKTKKVKKSLAVADYAASIFRESGIHHCALEPSESLRELQDRRRNEWYPPLTSSLGTFEKLADEAIALVGKDL